MKNLLMIALAFVTMNVAAQEDKKEARKAEMKERMEAREDLTPEEMAQLKTKKMTLHLDLTDQQQAEVEKLFLEEAKNRKEKVAEFKAQKEERQKLSKEEHLKMQNARLDHQIEMKRKMKAILNADQYAKFEEMQSKKDGKKKLMRRHKTDRK